MQTLDIERQSGEIVKAQPQDLVIDYSASDRKRRGQMVKPASSGWVERVIVVGGGLSILYTFGATVPIAAGAALVGMGLYFLKEVKEFQTPENAENLKNLLESKTPKHKSIQELKKDLLRQYGADACNQALREMAPYGEWIEFSPKSKHPLRYFGTVYCYVDPDDGEIMLPIQGLMKKFKQWHSDPTVDVEAETVEEVKAIAAAYQNEPDLGGVPHTAGSFGVQDAVSGFSQADEDLFGDRIVAVNPIDVLGDRLRSILMIAPPGAGKGILISNLIRHFKAQNPNLKFFAFDGKDMPEETGYWLQGPDEVVRVDLDREDPVKVAKIVLFLIERSHTADRDSVLLIDELNTLITVLDNGRKFSTEKKDLCAAALGTVLKKLSTAASTGDSRNNHIWAIGQNPNLSKLGTDGGTANQFRKLAIAMESNSVHTDQLVLGTTYTGSKQDQAYRESIKKKIAASPRKRAFYDSGTAQWYAMGEMPNYSGFDRDSHQQVGKPPALDLPPAKIWCGYRPQDQDPGSPSESAQPSTQSFDAPNATTDEWTEQLNWAIAEMGSARQSLEANGISEELADDLEALAERLQPIVVGKRYDLLCIMVESLRKGEIKAANINANYHRKQWYKDLKNALGGDREGVRNLFRELASMGIGQTFGEKEQLSYLLLPNDERRLSAKQIAEADAEESKGTSTVDIREVSVDWLPNLEKRLASIEQPTAEQAARECEVILGYPAGSVSGDRVNQLVNLINSRPNVKIAA